MTGWGHERVAIALQDLMTALCEVAGRTPFRDSDGPKTTMAVELADGHVLDISDLTGEDLLVTTDAAGVECVQVLGFAVRAYPDMATYREVAGWHGRGFCPPDLHCLTSLVATAMEAAR